MYNLHWRLNDRNNQNLKAILFQTLSTKLENKKELMKIEEPLFTKILLSLPKSAQTKRRKKSEHRFLIDINGYQ